MLWYQHDGARPHRTKENEKHWAIHGAQKGYGIRVATQPPQSPDMNWPWVLFQLANSNRSRCKRKCRWSHRRRADVLDRVSARKNGGSFEVFAWLVQMGRCDLRKQNVQPLQRQQNCPRQIIQSRKQTRSINATGYCQECWGQVAGNEETVTREVSPDQYLKQSGGGWRVRGDSKFSKVHFVRFVHRKQHCTYYFRW